MTREEVENELLTTGTVAIDSADGRRIVLNGTRGIRLAQIVFDRLQSSSASDLANNRYFFDALEDAFVQSGDEIIHTAEASEIAGEPAANSDRRAWRLKKVEARGFGGLNSVSGDNFEFDAAARDLCIEGQNGSGKTSLANAVLFVMTGKIHRDQYGLWDDPARVESVVSDDGKHLGDWPPIAVYPHSWGGNRPAVDVSVTLTFGNETDDEEVQAKRRFYGDPRGLKQEVFIDSKLTAVPTLIEAGLLMPMRIQHIRVPEANDNGQLVGLIRQLIGLEPLLDVAELVDKLTHGNQGFLRYARENDFDGKAKQIRRLLDEAAEKIRGLGTDLSLTLQIEAKGAVADERLQSLGEAKTVLDRRQAEGFKALALLAFENFDPDQADDRQRVADAINQLHLDASRQNDARNLPSVLGGIAQLAKRVGDEDVEALKATLRKASSDLSAAIKWANRQKEDMLFRLKAVAAVHFTDCEDPRCPLCQQPITEPKHRGLVDDLRILKTDAEAAQSQLADACRRIEQEVRSAAQHVVPDKFMRVGRFAVRRNIQEHVRSTFVEAKHVAVNLPGFVSISQEAVAAAFEEVEEVEFGSRLPEPKEGDELARLERLLDHLKDTINAAENWKDSQQAFRDAWARLFSKNDERSLTTNILKLKDVIEGVEPYRSASERVGQALTISAEYNAIIKRQESREKIAALLRPLRQLRELVNSTARHTIDDVSGLAKEIHRRIYNPEALTYERAEVSEHRGKQSLTFQAKLGNDTDWQIDASLLANVSWMRGVLWSFVFAIREQATKRAGHCPFELMVLDDPQMTFDTRNLKGWVRFLGSSEELRMHQRCQLIVTTHSMPFALEMTAMPDIQMAAIETGQPWSNPSQVVEGDFAAVRFQKMKAENSDERARLLVGDIRVLAETLLKHAIEPFDPAFVRQSEATLGRMIEWIAERNTTGQPPYTDRVFGELIAVKSSNPDRFSQLSEPHHSVSEMITVREAQRAYEFWRNTLFPALRKVWEEYRFLQKSIVGEVAAVPLPANCNHKPHRSAVLATARPAILGRVSAYSDGRAASAIRIDNLPDGDVFDLSALAAYRLEKDTLSPVAQVGDILLTRLDSQCRASNLVVEDRGTFRVARRWHEDKEAPTLAVLAASSSNPREVPSAVISRAKGANRRKIIGVLFAADKLQPGDTVDPDTEATDLDANNRVVADLVADTDVFEVQGSSAEPIALENQYLLAKRAKTDVQVALRELDGRPVIAEDSENCAFFKRLRVLDFKSVILESLDKTGSEGLIPLSTEPGGVTTLLTRVREVVGVIFDRL